MFNVLVVGQTGDGKSSVVNLIAGQNLAPTGDDLQHCTERCTEYPILVGGHQFQVFDTFGVLEPQVDGKLYTEAIADTYGAINAFKARGGIDIILYCIRDDKTNDLQKMKNYFRLFHEVLCDEEVPIAVVVTNRGSSMSTLSAERYKAIFTARNIAYIDCICVNVASTHGLDDPVDTTSQEAIRRLLVKSCEVPESRSKLQQFWRAAKNLAGRGQSLKRKQVSTLLTQRCKMNSETAGLVVAALDLEAPSNRLYRAPYARGKSMTRKSLLSTAHMPEEQEPAVLDASSGSRTPSSVDNTTVPS